MSAATAGGRPIELRKERSPTDAGEARRAFVDRVELLDNRGVQIGEREKRAVAQDRQDPALGDLHTDFDFGFVGRRGDTGRNDHRAIVGGRGPRTCGSPPVRSGSPS